jgi:hypothetical protein
MRLPWFVDAHANEKDDEIAFNLRGHAPVDDRSHGRFPGEREEIRPLYGVSRSHNFRRPRCTAPAV